MPRVKHCRIAPAQLHLVLDRPEVARSLAMQKNIGRLAYYPKPIVGAEYEQFKIMGIQYDFDGNLRYRIIVFRASNDLGRVAGEKDIRLGRRPKIYAARLKKYNVLCKESIDIELSDADLVDQMAGFIKIVSRIR